MRILMINVVCGIRSTGRICTDLATALDQNGHEVKIAYGRDRVPEEYQKYAVRIGSDLDVLFHGLKARMFDGCGRGSKRATKQFIDWINDYNPDVIHLHNLHGYYLNLQILFDYLRVCGKKIIWTLHDCWAFTGHTAYCDAVNCDRWVTGCCHCPCLKEYPASLIDRSKQNWENKKKIMNSIPNLVIVTPSEWLAGMVRKSFLGQYPVKVVPNGINTSQFHKIENSFKETYNIRDKKMLLGVSSSWDNMKGYADFLKLSIELGEEYQVVLVGLTKKQKDKLPKSVVGFNRTNSIQELAQIYSAADLFLNLSYCENYPTVNLEAIACGTPVLTYDVGGSKESALFYGKYAVRKGDLSAIKTQISTILRSKLPNLRDEIITKHDISNFLNDYMEYYCEKRIQ